MSYLTGEEELEQLAEELKSYTKEAVKMEPAPWIKDYEVDMDELFCELTLEKLENKLSGVNGQPLTNYMELFDDKDDETTESVAKNKLKIKCTKISGARKSVRRRAKKVLVKGGPGYRENEPLEANCI